MGKELKSKRTESAEFYAATLDAKITAAEQRRADFVDLISRLQTELEHYSRLCGRFDVPNGHTVHALGMRIDRLIGDPPDD